MVFSLLPLSAFAATTASGTCGENVTWSLDNNGTLTISGTGEMQYYSSTKNDDGEMVTTAPWGKHYKSIKRVVIMDGITSIRGHVFSGCSNLTSVEIPDGATYIGIWAFHGCSSLTSVTIPDSVTYINSGAFYGCSRLSRVVLSDSITFIYSDTFRDCSSLTSVTIPDSVTSIEASAFEGCSSLTSVEMPDSVANLGERVFHGTAFYNDPANWKNGLLYLNRCLIGAKNDITDAAIKADTRLIAGSAFEDCSSLTKVTIPNSVTSIGDSAFSGCSNLKSVTIPDSIVSLGGGVFYGTAFYNDPATWENGLRDLNGCL